MKRIIWVVVCVAIAASAAGCNTVKGVGKDIERAGEGIQHATEK